jgi:hypothetical protein
MASFAPIIVAELMWDIYIYTHTYIYCDWFTTSIPTPRIHDRKAATPFHLLSNARFGNPQSPKMPTKCRPRQKKTNGSRGIGIHLPLPPFADHSSNVCGKMNMGSHECMTGDLMVEQGRKLLEIYNIYIYTHTPNNMRCVCPIMGCGPSHFHSL